ncbi:hypothetical protein CK203_106057 [Vitis vinifera]|uniref:Uncharacterized protein n=1 Tax=Vitis vinifera TaxID=29760 RepID=A0A438C5T3_VITVI|nr:hypothetical protein CK203_106057 [Vitis vinifera]
MDHASLGKKCSHGKEGFGRTPSSIWLTHLTCMHQIINELLGARKAYQSLYGESIEEDVASRLKASNASVG